MGVHPDEPGAEGPMAQVLGGRRLVIATNRGPVEFARGANGRLATKRGPGGVVTALASLGRDVPLTWVAATLTPGDREAFPSEETSARTVRLQRAPLAVRYVPVTPEQHARHYDAISNNVLWFLQHYLWDAAMWPDFTDADLADWDLGYRPVNEEFARAIAGAATADAAGPRDGSGAVVLLHDYHLYLAPALVRARLPRATLAHFVHIPWPEARYWELLPERLLMEIFEGVAANDLLGFHTHADVRNFLTGASTFLAGARVDYERGIVTWRRHRLRVRAYPIPIDADEVRGALRSADGRRGREELAPLLGDDCSILVRVDRLDPTKNILRGFRAYDLLLRSHPELRGRVRFLAFLVPSRQDLPIYRDYARAVRRLVAAINAEHGERGGWQPIVTFTENNRPRALVALERYDALLVNSVFDGMNLVAKEGPAVNARDGVLVLSRTTGAYEQLRDAVLPVTATDVGETAEHLYEALRMGRAERVRLAQRAREIVGAQTPTDWAVAQVRDALGGERRVSVGAVRRSG